MHMDIFHCNYLLRYCTRRPKRVVNELRQMHTDKWLHFNELAEDQSRIL